jgi:hypothetical protein
MKTKSFGEWLKENPPPDLQALADRYGGIGNVPDEAWAEHPAPSMSGS